MNIYRVVRKDNDHISHGQYVGFVCVAESEEQASHMNPDYDILYNFPLYYNFEKPNMGWVSNVSDLDVVLIGTTSLFDEPQIILTDFWED